MRYLVLSDIHSNLEALEAVVNDAGPFDEVWCLGDVVGYGPDPNACVELLRSLPHQCIAGNHDWATLGKLDLEDFNSDAREANLWNREQLTAENLAFLGDLPQTIRMDLFTLVHGSPRYPIWEYVINVPTAEANFDRFDTPYCLVGHTHTPVIFRQNVQSDEQTGETVQLPPNDTLSLGPERLIINPGSVGQPRDGNPKASYALVDLETLSVEHRRVAYPLEETRAKMVQHDLPIRLAVRLGYGW